jgi:peptide/nickel transport system substrate-binding protein
MGTIPPDDIERVTQSLKDKYEFKPIPQNGYTYIGLKQIHPILSDKLVRQALMYGANRQQIVDDVLQGYGEVMNANLPSVSWAYAGPELNEYKYDPEKAKSLLEQPVDSGSRRHSRKDGKKLSFKNSTRPRKQDPGSRSVIIQKNWKDFGVDSQVEYIEWSVAGIQYWTRAQFEAYALGWSWRRP